MGNMLKTIILLGILSVLLIFAGGALAGKQGLYIALVLSLLLNMGAYFFSDRLALAANGAQPLEKQSYPQIYALVEDLTKRMNLPMPKLYFTPMQQANAFATGRDPQHASVAVTEGLLHVLSEDELRAVLAHELSHVKNHDILLVSIAAVIASAISFIANMALYSGLFTTKDDDTIHPFAAILLAIFIPIAASIIQFAISRQREYDADATGANTIGSGDPLARALLTIHETTSQSPIQSNQAYSSLYIDNPMGDIGGKLLQLFSTHPPIEERIKRLQAIH
jgi:heat shock protein HtpX